MTGESWDNGARRNRPLRGNDLINTYQRQRILVQEATRLLGTVFSLRFVPRLRREDGREELVTQRNISFVNHVQNISV
jgi:hypothetical protein